MLKRIIGWWRVTSDSAVEIAGIDARYRSQVRVLEEEIKLRDMQIKSLVAENERNFERIKAETAAFSAQVVSATSGRN